MLPSPFLFPLFVWQVSLFIFKILGLGPIFNGFFLYIFQKSQKVIRKKEMLLAFWSFLPNMINIWSGRTKSFIPKSCCLWGYGPTKPISSVLARLTGYIASVLHIVWFRVVIKSNRFCPIFGPIRPILGCAVHILYF